MVLKKRGVEVGLWRDGDDVGDADGEVLVCEEIVGGPCGEGYAEKDAASVAEGRADGVGPLFRNAITDAPLLPSLSPQVPKTIVPSEATAGDDSTILPVS